MGYSTTTVNTYAGETGKVAPISMHQLREPGISIKPSDRFENEIRRLNGAWRSKNFPQNNRCARRVRGTQSLFPNCVCRCANGLRCLVARARDGCLRRGNDGLRLLRCDPRVRLILTGRGNDRWNNNALEFRGRNFRGLLQHYDFLCLLPPGAKFRFAEGPHRCRWLDRCKWPRWNLDARLHFRGRR